MALKLGILSLLGNPWALYGEVKSTSYIFSKTIPAPETCDPLDKIPRYLSSSLSPKAGTVIEKSTKDTDCAPLDNNADAYRTSQYYMKADYNSGQITPTNFNSLISGSGTRAAVQDYYYNLKRQTQPRYAGSKLTGYQINAYTASTDTSYGKSPVIENYSDYFIYFDWIGGANPQYPGGGNLHGVYLIDIEGNSVPLTTDNKNLGRIENIFVKGKTANILPAVYSAGNIPTSVEIVDGGALYETIFSNSGSTTGFLVGGYAAYIESGASPGMVVTVPYDVTTLRTQSAYPNTLFDSGSGWLKYMLTGSGIGTDLNVKYIQPLGTNFQLYNKRTGQYASLNELVPYEDTFFPLKYGDMIRFGINTAGQTGSIDYNYFNLGISTIVSNSLDNTSALTTSSLFVDKINTQFPSNYTLQNIRVIRRVPNESFILIKNNPSYGDPGFLIPWDFNPNYDVYELARKAGVIQ